LHRRIHPAALAVAAILPLASGSLPARGAGEIDILVLREHGVGTATLAQPYLDRFMAIAAEQNGWDAARGQYLTQRTAASGFIKEHSPHYAILSLGAFLALREPYRLEVIGRVASTLVGGEQYFVVSKSARDLAACKGQKLATNYGDDPRFIERVVARGAFKLSDFQVTENQRPLQSLKQVLSGEAACALIDDAQLAELQHLEGGSEVHPVWSSAKVPQMVVAAFPVAPAAERERFRQNLSHVCDGDGATACGEVGIRSLAPASASDYADLVSAYGH
jgi:hypothetical protein